MKSYACDKCGKILTKEENALKIKTEVLDRYFCQQCIEESVKELARKKKDAATIKLLAQMKGWLKAKAN